MNNGCCLCGRAILSDTRDWKVPLCADHFFKLQSEVQELIPEFQPTLEGMLNAAYEAGKKDGPKLPPMKAGG